MKLVLLTQPILDVYQEEGIAKYLPHIPDWPAHAADEVDRGEAHDHDRAAVRDAAADVVRIRVAVLDDVGRRRACCCREVSLQFQFTVCRVLP